MTQIIVDQTAPRRRASRVALILLLALAAAGLAYWGWFVYLSADRVMAEEETPALEVAGAAEAGAVPATAGGHTPAVADPAKPLKPTPPSVVPPSTAVPPAAVKAVPALTGEAAPPPAARQRSAEHTPTAPRAAAETKSVPSTIVTALQERSTTPAGTREVPAAPITRPPPAPMTAVATPAPATAEARRAGGDDTAPPPTGDEAEARKLLQEAESLRAAEQFLQAREKALAGLEQAQDPATRAALEKLLGEVGIALVMTPRPMPEKVEYVVQPGDTLGKIARQYGTTIELIERSNRLASRTIRPGDRLRVLNAPWSIVVNKTRNDLVLSLNGRFFKRYRVGTGEYAKTPTGEFKITERIPQPTWWHPDGRVIPYGHPENLLGTHWLALDIKGYGIHGTWEPETVGRQSSLGCVRLLNEDIEELFVLVPVGTPVAIED